MSLARTTAANQEDDLHVPSQIVTFRIADRVFGVDVGVVREIKGWQQPTPLPDSAGHVIGVINLRGQIVPVHDLALLLGVTGADTSAGKVVIVLDVGQQPYGIVADAVSDILDVARAEIRLSPFSGRRSDTLVSLLVVKNETVIALLNAEAVVADQGAPSLH